MADRDLQTQGKALHHVLSVLQRDVRTLKSRAGRPGATRSSVRDISHVLSSPTNNTVITLNELHLDPGQWVIFGNGLGQIDGGAFTGAERIIGQLVIIKPGVPEALLMYTANTPMCTPRAGAVTGMRYASSWTLFAVYHSDVEFTVLHQASAEDHFGVTHTILWTDSALLALPM